MSGNRSEQTWSQRVEKRYALELPPDVRAWLDHELWREPSGAEFCRARSPEQLLDPEPGVIWAGFMMPDTLPIIGNGYGDWLCLRIARDGSVSELIHWSHCGGDWIPYGRNLAEGLLYDAAQRMLQPRSNNLDGTRLPDEQVFGAARWASQWVKRNQQALQACWETHGAGDAAHGRAVLDLLERHGVAQFAISRDRILRHLESPLKAVGEPSVARQLGVDWEPEFVKWMFDAQLIPETQRRALVSVLGSTDGDWFAQDWRAAERTAVDVMAQRQDLGWAFDVAGWGAEKRCHWKEAVSYYWGGLRASWFSDDTVRFRTHWFDDGFGKFAAFRLASLADHLTNSQRYDPYMQLFLDADRQTLHTRVHQYWLTKAHAAERRGEQMQAYQCYYRAGWDVGLLQLDRYAEIYDGLQRSAKAAGAPVLAAIAQMHQRFLGPGDQLSESDCSR